MREIRVSPDGDAVAISTDNDPDGNKAFGVFYATSGGAWVPADRVATWTVLTTGGSS